MPTPWWKGAPPPTEAPALEPDAKPWAEEPAKPARASPTGFEEGTRLRCSAAGCTFETRDFATAALGAGVRPYCQHHAAGGELKVADLMWRLPCACGRAADGFNQVIGGYSGTHSATKCLERTLAASPDDLTVPMGTGLPAKPVEGSQVFSDRRCACDDRIRDLQAKIDKHCSQFNFVLPFAIE